MVLRCSSRLLWKADTHDSRLLSSRPACKHSHTHRPTEAKQIDSSGVQRHQVLFIGAKSSLELVYPRFPGWFSDAFSLRLMRHNNIRCGLSCSMLFLLGFIIWLCGQNKTCFTFQSWHVCNIIHSTSSIRIFWNFLSALAHHQHQPAASLEAANPERNIMKHMKHTETNMALY